MSSKKLDAAIDALVDALAELPEHELEGWQRGNRLGLTCYVSLAGAIPAWCRRRGRFGASRPEALPAPPGSSLGVPALCPLPPPMFFLGQPSSCDPPCNQSPAGR